MHTQSDHFPKTQIGILEAPASVTADNSLMAMNLEISRIMMTSTSLSANQRGGSHTASPRVTTYVTR